jgi:hypothetical protein
MKLRPNEKATTTGRLSELFSLVHYSFNKNLVKINNKYRRHM